MFLPKIYRKSVEDIDYEKLYDLGVRCLLFDLDNTIGRLDEGCASNTIISLFKKISKKFKIAIVSNNSSRKRVEAFANSISCDYFYLSMKPSIRVLKKAARKYSVKPNEICMIGDQLVTDILAANRFGAVSCLVDALAKKDLKITGLNRKIETIIIKKYEKLGKFRRGEYYE